MSATGALDRIGRELAGLAAPLTPPVVAGQTLHLAFADPARAAEAAGRVAGTFGAGAGRIAAHYGVAQWAEVPFGGPRALTGPAAGVAPDILASTPAGATHVSEAFAAALHIWTSVVAGDTACVGELPGPGEAIPLYAFTPARG